MEIKFFKNKKVFKKGGLHVSPDFLWNILQGVSFVIIISSFVLGFYLFYEINKGFVSSDQDVNSKTQLISTERINETLKIFSEKEKKSIEIINSPSPIIDPSQ